MKCDPLPVRDQTSLVSRNKPYTYMLDDEIRPNPPRSGAQKFGKGIFKKSATCA